MSDSHYPPPHAQLPHARYAETFAYPASSLTNGLPQHRDVQRQPLPYAHSPVLREGQQPRPGHPPYPASAFPLPQRSMTPSLVGHPQLDFSQGASRHRTQSISTAQATSLAHYAHAQSPPMLSDGGRHQPQSHLHSTQHTGYVDPHPLMHTAGYLHRPATPAPSSSGDYYCGYDGQLPPSLQRPFPCDMCALSFNRQHDLKRHRDTHSGERPFLCNGGCGKTFTRKDALKRHQLVKSCGRTED